MSFDTPNGTSRHSPAESRDSRPGSRLEHEPSAARAARSWESDALVLTAVGRKRGVERSTPVAYSRRQRRLAHCGSANGAAKHPAWYHNIAAHPDQVKIEMAGRTVVVNAEQLHGEAREHAWGPSRKNYRVSQSMSRKPTASCLSFVCEPAHIPVTSR